MTSLLLITSLSGCVETTQTKSARIKLTDDRVLATQVPLVITRRDSAVSVTAVGAVRAGREVGVAVTLRNDGAGVVSDLPIAVGVRDAHGRDEYLNTRANLPYFQTHVGAIAGGASVTWVLTTSLPVAPGARPFAVVGVPSVSDQAGARTLPTIAAGPERGAGGAVAVTVANHSDVPQVDLAVYVHATSAGRLRAAGQATVAQLDPGASATTAIRLVGAPGNASLQLDVPPANLR